MSGHYARNLQWTNEVWGLAHLSEGKFITVSDDATFRLWSSEQRKQLSILNLNIDSKGTKLPMDPKTNDLQDCSRLRSIAVMSSEKHVMIGCKDGTLRVVDLKRW
jgi:hypothetical protein